MVSLRKKCEDILMEASPGKKFIFLPILIP